MNVVILAGGLGTRLAEETEVKPKPMVEIGERPILWHIMKHYAAFGFTDVFVALGHKGHLIKRYFLDECSMSGDLTVDLPRGHVERSGASIEPWKVRLLDTGAGTNTGGRLKRMEPWLRSGTFMLTYGDGVSNVKLDELLRFHRDTRCIATISAVRPPARFGSIEFEGPLVRNFAEKPQAGEGWINGGFMVFEPEVFDYLDGDATSLEMDALERLAAEGKLAAYRHDGFWQCMDTLRDKRLLEHLWTTGDAPWRIWE